MLPAVSTGIGKNRTLFLTSPSSYPGWKASGVGTESASGSRLLPGLEVFSVSHGTCFRVLALTPGGMLERSEQNAIPVVRTGIGKNRKLFLTSPSSYPGWKALGVGMESASGFRFSPRPEAFRVSRGTCLLVALLSHRGRF